MGDIISAIHDDMDTYRHLCEKYGHRVRMSNGNPDCYGVHAGKLGRKEKSEEERRVGNAVPIETEVKLRINEDVICRLEKELGRSWEKTVWEKQENIIYRIGDGFVRFRRENGEVTLTIKGKRLSGEYNERPEIECKLPIDFFEQAIKSGCGDAVVYSKLRASYDYGSCTVCLDNLDGQHFVEIEGTKPDITSARKKLRLENFPIITQDYAQIFSQRTK